MGIAMRAFFRAKVRNEKKEFFCAEQQGNTNIYRQNEEGWVNFENEIIFREGEEKKEKIAGGRIRRRKLMLFS